MAENDDILELKPGDKDWGDGIQKDIEKAIESFLIEIAHKPYMHRVEHSLHIDISNVIEKELAKRNQLFHEKGYKLIQKEWPETKPRLGLGKTKRGNFDLAILSPKTNFDDDNEFKIRFKNGRIEPVYVFEVGFGYKHDHFVNDLGKLDNSKPYKGYVIHIDGIKRKLSEETIKNFNDEIKKLDKNKIRIYFLGFDFENGQVKYRKKFDVEDIKEI